MGVVVGQRAPSVSAPRGFASDGFDARRSRDRSGSLATFPVPDSLADRRFAVSLQSTEEQITDRERDDEFDWLFLGRSDPDDTVAVPLFNRLDPSS